MNFRIGLAVLALVVGASAQDCWAWGATSQRRCDRKAARQRSGLGGFTSPTAGSKSGRTWPTGGRAARLAAGATALRNMIVDAWQRADAGGAIRMVNVRDIESGKVRVSRDLFGAD
jgi:hypothetical protein